jgi:hypothetical protein
MPAELRAKFSKVLANAIQKYIYDSVEIPPALSELAKNLKVTYELANVVMLSDDVLALSINVYKVFSMLALIFQCEILDIALCYKDKVRDVFIENCLALPDAVVNQTTVESYIRACDMVDKMCINCTCQIHDDKLPLLSRVNIGTSNIDIRFHDIKNHSRSVCITRLKDYSGVEPVRIAQLIHYTYEIHKVFPSSVVQLIISFLYHYRNYSLYEVLFKFIMDPNIVFSCEFASEAERAKYIKMYITLNDPHRELLAAVARLYPTIWQQILDEELIYMAPFYKIQGIT